MDVWECDLVDEQLLSKYISGVRYLLSVIDVFIKIPTGGASEIEGGTLRDVSIHVRS